MGQQVLLVLLALGNQVLRVLLVLLDRMVPKGKQVLQALQALGNQALLVLLELEGRVPLDPLEQALRVQLVILALQGNEAQLVQQARLL